MTYIGYVKLENDSTRPFQVEAESYAIAVLAVENYYSDYVIEELAITDHVIDSPGVKVAVYC